MRSCCLATLPFALLANLAPIAAQEEIPRTEYIRFVPLRYPRPVRQTAASVELQLFGDTAAADYVDVAPRDGIDDRRAATLHALAARFSPLLVRNTTNVPMNWRRFREQGKPFPLFVDTWETATTPPQLLRSVQIDLGDSSTSPCPPSGQAIDRLASNDDCAVLALLRDFDPDAPAAEYYQHTAVSPSTVPFSVIYFDFPGYGPASWRAEYEARFSRRLPRRYDRFARIYAHPFVSRRGPDGGYELLFQFWFFYPLNDGANKHEGDWEHLNVAIAPRSKVDRPLTAADVRAILEQPHHEAAADPLVIRRVEHFIHDHVMTLDYSVPNAYRPRAEWDEQRRQLPQERIGESKLVAAIRARAWADRAETVINTHPVGFIGGDSKGLELILAGPGSRNRDSHATYPFSGLYMGVGPAGATEEVRQRFDLRDYPPGTAKRWPATVERFDDTARIELLPDWERLHGLVQREAAVRREWSWLLLPIRWGFPATPSPLAGIIANAETGNLSPVGPTYNGGWNRPGPSAAFSAYDPNQFSGAFPLAPTDAFRNDLGFLNVGVAALSTLPPLDLVYKLIVRPARSIFPPKNGAVFAPTIPSHFRVVGLGIGATKQFLADESWPLLFLNARQLPALATSLSAAGIDTLHVHLEGNAEDVVVPIYQIQFYLGHGFVVENSVRYSRPTLGLDALESVTNTTVPVRGRLKMWEYAGSIRYNVLERAVQPYVKVGYGLTWYQLTGVSVNGALIAEPDANWIRRPSLSPLANLLPNTWHYGLGVEVIPVRPLAPLTGVSVGARLEWAVYNQSLGLSFGDRLSIQLADEPPVHRHTLSGMLIVAF